jgi:hypothetical protein
MAQRVIQDLVMIALPAVNEGAFEIDTTGNLASLQPYGATTATASAAAANPLRWLGQFQLDNRW